MPEKKEKKRCPPIFFDLFACATSFSVNSNKDGGEQKRKEREEREEQTDLFAPICVNIKGRR